MNKKKTRACNKFDQLRSDPIPFFGSLGKNLHSLCDLFVGFAQLALYDSHWVFQDLSGEFFDFFLESSAKQQRLPVGSHMIRDRTHLWLKTLLKVIQRVEKKCAFYFNIRWLEFYHIEHAIRFVKDQISNAT